MVAEALRSRYEVVELFALPEKLDPSLAEAAARRGSEIMQVTPSVAKALSDTPTPQGVVAVVRHSQTSLDELPVERGLVLVLDAVRDPGNAGTLIRSAVAAGCDAAVLTATAVDPFAPKVVRASAGAIFHVPIVTDTPIERALGVLASKGFRSVGADARSPVSYDSIDLSVPTALVVGNEAHGLAGATVSLLDDTVSIPMPGPAESLNVGIAGSLLLFEAVRQRRQVSSPQNA